MQYKELNHSHERFLVNATCKGQCPEARGYYIGLKRQMEENQISSNKWIWSNNVTWTENDTEVGQFDFELNHQWNIR